MDGKSVSKTQPGGKSSGAGPLNTQLENPAETNRWQVGPSECLRGISAHWLLARHGLRGGERSCEDEANVRGFSESVFEALWG